MGLFGAYLSFIHLASSPNWDTDYKYLYFSAQQLLKHADIYYPLRFFSPSLNGVTEIVNLNPPLVAVLMAPLGWLSYSLSFWLWSLLNLILEIISVVLIVHQFFRPQTAKYLLSFAGILWLLAYFPTFANLYAQTAGVVFFLITLGWLSFRQQKIGTAGFLWGIAFSIKLFAGLFLWMLIWRKEWQGLKKFLLATVICAIIPILMLGTDIYLKYYAIFTKVTWYSASWNASLLGFFARLFGYGNEQNVAFMAYPQLTPILYLFVVVLLLLAFKWLRYIPVGLQAAKLALMSADFAVAYTIVAMLLISPLAWVYYFVLLFIPGAIVFYWNQQLFKRDWLNVLLATAVFLSSVPHLLLKPRQIVSSYDIFWWSNCYCYALGILAVLIVSMRLLLHKNRLKMQPNLNQSWVVVLLTVAVLPSLLGIVTMIYLLIAVN